MAKNYKIHSNTGGMKVLKWKHKSIKKKKKSTTELEWECRMRSTLRLGLGYWLMKIYSDWYSGHSFRFRLRFVISCLCP